MLCLSATLLQAKHAQLKRSKAALCSQTVLTLWTDWIHLPLMPFLCAQTYLSMLCSMRWGLFFFFGGMCVIMTITVYLFYPETKGLGIEETPNVFKKHWCA